MICETLRERHGSAGKEGMVQDEQPATSGEEQEPEGTEVVDGVVVLASVRAIEPARDTTPPLRAVAAVAATGFVAGAATAAVLGRTIARRQARRTALGHAPLRAPGEALDVVASRRFIVDVHTLARR
jgi:hypothetical protein